MLFDMISRIVGLPHNVFAIGNLMVTKNIKVENLEIDYQVVEPDVVVLRDINAKKVYVDRSIINKNKLREDLEENLDLNDYKFILSNLSDIVRELSLLEFKKEEEYMSTILNILGNAM